MLDVVIAGAGPAGLSAALILGRCRRSVLLCDTGRPRNFASRGLHGFLSRDGIHPDELRRVGREQLAPYPSVRFRETAVADARRLDDRFVVTLASDEELEARFLLLATGVVDELPPILGIAECYGVSAFHCPYCDGWEQQGRPLALFGHGEEAVEYALELRVWSEDVALLTNGDTSLAPAHRARLERHRVQLVDKPIARAEHREGRLERIVFADGSALPRQALFWSPGQRQHSALAEKLGCSLKDNLVEVGRFQVTATPGLFVAGDAARSVQLAVIAAAEGAQAAFAINDALIAREFG